MCSHCLDPPKRVPDHKSPYGWAEVRRSNPWPRPPPVEPSPLWPGPPVWSPDQPYPSRPCGAMSRAGHIQTGCSYPTPRNVEWDQCKSDCSVRARGRGSSEQVAGRVEGADIPGQRAYITTITLHCCQGVSHKHLSCTPQQQGLKILEKLAALAYPAWLLMGRADMGEMTWKIFFH